MARKTSRRALVQAAGLAASGLMATRASADVVPEPHARPAQSRMGAHLRALMNGPEPLICRGAYDVLTARLLEAYGFKGAFVGTRVVNQALVGQPDRP